MDRAHTVLIHTHFGMWVAAVLRQVAVHDVGLPGCAIEAD